MVMETQVNSTIPKKGDVDTGPSTGTVDAQAPVFTRVQQASIDLQWLMIYKHDHIVLKNQSLVHGRPGFRRDLKQTVEHRLPFIFQNDRLSPGSRGDFKATVEPRLPFYFSKHAVEPRLSYL